MNVHKYTDEIKPNGGLEIKLNKASIAEDKEFHRQKPKESLKVFGQLSEDIKKPPKRESAFAGMIEERIVERGPKKL